MRANPPCYDRIKLKSPPFEYTRAGSVGEACELLGRHGDDAKVLAGGQSLVPMMAMRLLRPAWLVDINEIAALKFIRVEADAVRMGACTRQVEVERDAALARRLPILAQALKHVGHQQTRNRGTVGGSLAHADPSAELPLVARMLDAELLLRKDKGARTVRASDFFTGAMSTALAPDECLEEIRWPLWPERRTGSAFDEVSIRHGDFALAAAAAQVALDDSGRCTRAVLGLGGVGTAPRAFEFEALDKDRIDEAVASVVGELEPTSDLHASAEYRRSLARVLGTRVLRVALEEANAR
jgi:CO/xanthine dehydrogenase FAD-binding subunit